MSKKGEIGLTYLQEMIVTVLVQTLKAKCFLWVLIQGIIKISWVIFLVQIKLLYFIIINNFNGMTVLQVICTLVVEVMKIMSRQLLITQKVFKVLMRSNKTQNPLMVVLQMLVKKIIAINLFSFFKFFFFLKKQDGLGKYRIIKKFIIWKIFLTGKQRVVNQFLVVGVFK